ncbi:esterase [Neosynechococcus sphagnicola sy1]|uniref:Esterase n=1 Tax=Neosynechococcus sphagnicola sy1 TaxID=1497020 RepID=A0A098TQ45_9CYAN|nr:alpha/beta hydrolase [Neosynechococcus sphagnicola]KGF72948.1 esterase [Neosynechococcus sphagnicola sy1]
MNLLPTSVALCLCLLAVFGFLLSLWIVIPAPTEWLLPLAVGAPELSPWLLGLNLLVMVLSFLGCQLLGWQQMGWLRLSLGLSLVAVIWSAVPLVQLPGVIDHANLVMQRSLGADYAWKIPHQVVSKLRSQPFQFQTAFTGIAIPTGRETLGIEFAAPDHQPLKLDVYHPDDVGLYPAIVVIYGGAWQRGSPSQNQPFSRYMANQGYTVVAVSYRHAPRFHFPAQLEDIQAALGFIHDHAIALEIDTQRLALMGWSAGAHLAMLAAYQPSTFPVQAVVSYYGPVDLAKGYYDLPKPDPMGAQAILRTFIGGSPPEFPLAFQQASPIHWVRSQLPPTLLVYGGHDHVVEARFGQHLSEELQAAGNTTVFLEIPWAEHAFDAVFNGPSNQLALYYTERFLAWALKPGT